MSVDHITPLLDILQNPDNPSFEQALARLPSTLEQLELAKLSPDNRTALLARIQSVMAEIETHRSLTSTQLSMLRNRGKALKSYGNK